MNELRVFKNDEFGELNIVIEDGKELFPATECARMLGYTNPRDAIERHCKNDGVVKHDGVATRTNQYGTTTKLSVEKTYITEGNLYRLIIRSKLPTAAYFEQWVFEEVLPSIRKHGIYATPDTVEAMLQDPDTMIKTLQALKEERLLRETAEKKIEQQKPLVRFAETCQTSKDSILIRELAKVCSKNKKIGQNSLFRQLRKWKLLNSNNEPYQQYVDKGYFEIIERAIHTKDGVILKFTPKVLPKGQRYIINRLEHEAAMVM